MQGEEVEEGKGRVGGTEGRERKGWKEGGEGKGRIRVREGGTYEQTFSKVKPR